MQRLKDQLKRHEGFRDMPYRDSVGVWTIGYGRNLEDNGISESEASLMLDNDISFAMDIVDRTIWCQGLNTCRKNVITNMIFNMGFSGVIGFKRMIVAIVDKNYGMAADEMLDSKWARQVGSRAIELADQMRSGCCL